MISAFWLMLLQGLLGAFDTVYYHECKARLPAGGALTRLELWLHGARDLVYALLFGTLPVVAWCGQWALVLMGLIGLEIVMTMADFVVEVKSRAPVGVLAGERVTHGCMAIVYGAMLACLLPNVITWYSQPSAFVSLDMPVPGALRVALLIMAGGVLLSGVRDVYAALGLPGGSFPWSRA